MARIPRPTHRRRGSTLVETALVLPLVLMFILGVFEYGRYLMVLQTFTNAAREGARYALTHTVPITIQGTTTGNATSDVTNTINASLAGLRLTGQNTQVYSSDSLGNNIGTWTDTQAGGWICVKISGTYQVVVTKILALPSSIPVQVQVVMRSEGN